MRGHAEKQLRALLDVLDAVLIALAVNDLERHPLAGAVVERLVDDSVRSLADLAHLSEEIRRIARLVELGDARRRARGPLGDHALARAKVHLVQARHNLNKRLARDLAITMLVQHLKTPVGKLGWQIAAAEFCARTRAIRRGTRVSGQPIGDSRRDDAPVRNCMNPSLEMTPFPVSSYCSKICKAPTHKRGCASKRSASEDCPHQRERFGRHFSCFCKLSLLRMHCLPVLQPAHRCPQYCNQLTAARQKGSHSGVRPHGAGVQVGLHCTMHPCRAAVKKAAKRRRTNKPGNADVIIDVTQWYVCQACSIVVPSNTAKQRRHCPEAALCTKVMSGLPSKSGANSARSKRNITCLY